MRIAVILSSRGLSFSETMDELLRELKGLDYEIFFSIGRTLPDCFNVPLEEALKDKTFTHFLVVEDDMILPKGILKQMLETGYPVVALDYPFKKDGEATTLHDPSGMALYTGTGFILIDRIILDKMPLPIFRTDTAWDMMISKDNKLIIWARDVSNIKTYGLHDVNFGLTMWANDIPILVMKRTAGQHKLRAKGKSNTNSGADEIFDITVVKRDNTAKSCDTQLVDAYLDRLHKVVSVEILDKCPDFIHYVDGQARLKEGKDVVV